MEIAGYESHNMVISKAIKKYGVENFDFLILEEVEEEKLDEREIYLSGENNSLDGYTVKASEEYGIMVFSNPDKPGNAAYVMSLQQGMFFINRYVREQELAQKTGRRESSMESTATKQELRATEHVKVRNACRGFGKNMVDSMRQLSPVLDKKLKS